MSKPPPGPLDVLDALEEDPLLRGTVVCRRVQPATEAVFADLPQVAPTVDIEAVLARDPQVILSTDDTVADPAAQWRRWPQLAAVRAGAVYALPSDLVARATPLIRKIR